MGGLVNNAAWEEDMDAQSNGNYNYYKDKEDDADSFRFDSSYKHRNPHLVSDGNKRLSEGVVNNVDAFDRKNGDDDDDDTNSMRSFDAKGRKARALV